MVDARHISLSFEIPTELTVRGYSFKIAIDLLLTNFIGETDIANSVKIRTGVVSTDLTIDSTGRISQTVNLFFDDLRTFEILIYPIDPISNAISVSGTVILKSFEQYAL